MKTAIWFFLTLAIATASIMCSVHAQAINSGVAFREEGLPSGTEWAVICNGTLYNSTSQDISITLPPGTYPFSVPEVSGYKATPLSGNVTAILDPIMLTTITFASAIPEFNVDLVPLVALLSIAVLAAIVLAKVSKRRAAAA